MRRIITIFSFSFAFLLAFFLSAHLASAAIINITGFETGDFNEASTNAGTINVTTTVVRTGTYAIRVNPTTNGTGSYELLSYSATTGEAANLNTATTTIRFYFRYATKPASGDEELMRVRKSAAGLKFALRLNSTGNLVSYDSNGNLLATGASVLAANTWYRIEVQVGSGTSAPYEVKIDGVSELSSTTANLNAGSAVDIKLGKFSNSNSQSVDFYYDDVAVDDGTTYPGAGQVKMLLPNANGNYQTWTTSTAGSHFQLVDEIPLNTTDYLISTLVANNAETEALQDYSTLLTSNSSTVNVVKLYAYVRRDGATNAKIRLRLRSGTTDSDTSADATTGSAFSDRARIFLTDPATSAAWTLSALDSVEVGVLERDTTNKSRVSFVALMVDYTPPPPVAPQGRMIVKFGRLIKKGLFKMAIR